MITIIIIQAAGVADESGRWGLRRAGRSIMPFPIDLDSDEGLYVLIIGRTERSADVG